MSEPVVLAPESVEAIARRTAELLAERSPPTPRLVDAATLAARLGVARSTVYERAAELGAVPIGEGRRPRLRFDLERALEAWTARQPAKPEHQPELATPRRRSSTSRTTHLLPIRGQEAA